jgi:hypothetical protein
VQRFYRNVPYVSLVGNLIGRVSVYLDCHNNVFGLGVAFYLSSPDTGDFNIAWINLSSNAANDSGNAGTQFEAQVGNATGYFVVRDSNTSETVTGTFTTFDNGSHCSMEGNIVRTTAAN